MSIRLRAESVSPELTERFANELVVIKKAGFFGEAGSTKIICHYSQSGVITIPYYYATQLLGFNPAFSRPVTGTKKFTFKGELYPKQQDVMNEACNDLKTIGCTFLNVYTSYGKTVLGSYATCFTNEITMILMTNTILINQWANVYTKMTNCKVLIIDVGGKTYEKWKLNPPDVIICMDSRIHKVPPDVLA